jgi:hypothetical protein
LRRGRSFGRRESRGRAVFFFHCTDLVLSALCSRHCGSSMAAEDMAMLCEVGEWVANGGVRGFLRQV